jgi:hypothetical protein
MLKRILLALALVGALAACNTPSGGTTTTSSPALSTPAAPSVDESPSGVESMEPSESPSAS